ncbi:MAG: hypothetical protein ABSE62_01550 [Chthoniobacteraceae bacterium]|jgi:uncharacterized coiled-coil protein SlyX
MKKIAILPLAILFLSAGVVKSQAPLTGTVLANLQDMITANKTLIDKQQKTLDSLDQINQDAQQLKIFASRG